METTLVRGFLLVLSALIVHADVFMMNPRGSNNRLAENGRARRNANRMFDSQNNNRGGYNVGFMYYYAGSKMPIQWTNQHSCSNLNNNCELIVQYMCSKNLRDGVSTSTIPENNNQCAGRNCDTDKRFGMHEDNAHYENCKKRERNQGLFTADQNLRGDTAKHTRQNPGGTRRGYECPEERDYYPHWHPSPWKDIVIMTNNVSRCDYYKKESQNVKSRFKCVLPTGSRNTIPIEKEKCEAITGGKWTEVPAHNIPAPDCILNKWSRDNHNGNGVGGYMNTYNWTVPDIDEPNCALRIRYNISTNDFDSWATDSEQNGRPSTKVPVEDVVGIKCRVASDRGYTFKNNPVVQVFSKTARKLQLRLAINTAQYGRTFSDRTHRFSIKKRPTELEGKTIYNLNVRGKRGNIVQVYPGVEYDYVPNTLVIGTGDYIHFQWTGSNTNPGNNAGEGRRGTDRSNVVLLKKQAYSEGKPKPATTHGHLARNYPDLLKNDPFLGFGNLDLQKLAFLRVVMPILTDGVNLARGRLTKQSSTGWRGSSSKAVDGNRDGNYRKGSCTHTYRTNNPWWRVDLEAEEDIKVVRIWNRADCCWNRLRQVEVRVGNTDNNPQANPVCAFDPAPFRKGEVRELTCGKPLKGRYVYVTIKAVEYLTLCEVEIISATGGKSRSLFSANLALGRPTKQSSEGWGGNSARAVDGNREGKWWGRSCTHTRSQNGPWWRVDLGKKEPVSKVRITNRADCCWTRLKQIEVRVGDVDNNPQANALCIYHPNALGRGETKDLVCAAPKTGRFVYITLKATEFLTLCEVEVFSASTPGKKDVSATQDELPQSDSRNGGTLDDESPYFDLGPKKVTKAGLYYYMCTRNNNFSNRSQKGKIIVNAGSAKKDEAALEKAKPEEKSADKTASHEKASDEKSTTEITAENDWVEQISHLEVESEAPEEKLDADAKPVRVEKLTIEQGENIMKKEVGSALSDLPTLKDIPGEYVSDYIAVYPMEDFSQKSEAVNVELKLTKKGLDPDDVMVYQSKDMKAWKIYDKKDVFDDTASLDLDSGGYFVAKVNKQADQKESEQDTIYAVDQ